MRITSNMTEQSVQILKAFQEANKILQPLRRKEGKDWFSICKTKDLRILEKKAPGLSNDIVQVKMTREKIGPPGMKKEIIRVIFSGEDFEYTLDPAWIWLIQERFEKAVRLLPGYNKREQKKIAAVKQWFPVRPVELDPDLPGAWYEKEVPEKKPDLEPAKKPDTTRTAKPLPEVTPKKRDPVPGKKKGLAFHVTPGEFKKAEKMTVRKELIFYRAATDFNRRSLLDGQHENFEAILIYGKQRGLPKLRLSIVAADIVKNEVNLPGKSGKAFKGINQAVIQVTLSKTA